MVNSINIQFSPKGIVCRGIDELHLLLVQTAQQRSVQTVGNTTLALAHAGLGTA
jgi:hypothetical protein